MTRKVRQPLRVILGSIATKNPLLRLPKQQILRFTQDDKNRGKQP
jgi:hypothetical protein